MEGPLSLRTVFEIFLPLGIQLAGALKRVLVARAYLL